MTDDGRGDDNQSMPLRDALMALMVLAEWTPPEGITCTVSCSCVAERPDERQVRIVLMVDPAHMAVAIIDEMPTVETLDLLARSARQVLESAWDEPACIGLGPSPVSHPVYDLEDFGRDN